MEYALEVSRLCKEYEGFSLKDVSFRLPAGFIMGLIGPNGAGKTTIIKLIMNLLGKTSGEIKIFGLDHGLHELEVRARIGFVYDIPPFYEHLTVRQMKRIIAPFYRQWDEVAFERYLGCFDLDANKRIKNLSRGMHMKFALAVALSHRADFIIMDEPTSGLDPVFRREFLDLLSDVIQDEGRSVLFSTHITTDLERVADFITFIHQGEIVFSDTREQILENWGVVKAERKLLTAESRSLFSGLREDPFSFEGLIRNLAEARSRFGNGAVIERATLEDIMYLFNRGMQRSGGGQA